VNGLLRKDRLSLALRPSLIHCVVISIVHLVALAGIFLTQLDLHYKLAFCLAVLASLTYWVNRFGFLHHPLSVIGVDFVRERWMLSLKSGEQIEVQLESPIVVLSFLIVLNFRDTRGRKFPLTILSGSIGPEEARHSRIFLLWGTYHKQP